MKHKKESHNLITIHSKIQKTKQDNNKLKNKYNPTTQTTPQKTRKKYDPEQDKEFMEKMNKINEYHKKRIENLNKKQDKDAENKIKITKERMKTKNAKKYKVWDAKTNNCTMHMDNHNQTVLLDEKFKITNNITGKTEYLDFPGEWTGSPENINNCKCEMNFTNNKKQ